MDEQQHRATQGSTMMVPAAIVIAGALIAGAVYFGSQRDASGVTSPAEARQEEAKLLAALDTMTPVTSDDHIRGNPDAPVKIVEYSDTECPFCKNFHATMQEVMKEYGASGKVAWVYRQFPLVQLHSKAPKEAEATECANELGGPDAFWAYLDRLFEVTPSNDGLDMAELPKIARYVGLDEGKFNACLALGAQAKRVEEDANNAMATGGNGTPWSIVVAKNGKKYPLSGAQPYASVKELIERALQER